MLPPTPVKLDTKAKTQNLIDQIKAQALASVAESDEDEGDSASAGKGAVSSKSLTTDNSTTVFVKNLPFSTADADLKAHFEHFGPVRYARVVKDRATDRPAGTGFVCFILAYFYLPEMKNRSYREIDILFKRKVPARKWTKTEVDIAADELVKVFLV